MLAGPRGRVGGVLTELDQWQMRPGEPPPGEAATAEERRDPRRAMAQARTYLGNNRDRMAYPRYRREGLPTPSSLVESLVGEVNARVKSTQKHWNRPAGAESILQLPAAVLSQDDRLPGSSPNGRGARSANEAHSVTNQRMPRREPRRDLRPKSGGRRATARNRAEVGQRPLPVLVTAWRRA